MAPCRGVCTAQRLPHFTQRWQGSTRTQQVRQLLTWHPKFRIVQGFSLSNKASSLNSILAFKVLDQSINLFKQALSLEGCVLILLSFVRFRCFGSGFLAFKVHYSFQFIQRKQNKNKTALPNRTPPRGCPETCVVVTPTCALSFLIM